MPHNYECATNDLGGRKPTKVVSELESAALVYGYGWRNSGDLAINQGSIKYLNTAFPSVVPRVISIHPETSREFSLTKRYLGDDGLRYDLRGGPVRYSPTTRSSLTRFVHLATDGVRYGLDRVRAPRLHPALGTEMTRSIRNADFVFFNGGNLIHHNRTLPYLLGILYPLQVAKQYGVPYGILPHTIFDIEGRYQSMILSILNESKFVWTRDKQSFRYLVDNYSLSCPIRNGIDTAFFVQDASAHNVPPTECSQRENPRIAVVPRFSTLGDTAALHNDAVERQFKQFLIQLCEKQYDVVVTVQTKVEEEWVASNRAFLNGNGVTVFSSFDPRELRAHYSGVDVLVTMRLHAGIFALSMGTPAIGLYRSDWGPKTPGTWENLGIGKYAVSCDTMNVDYLVGLCEEALGGASGLRETILENIGEKTEYMVAEMHRMMG